MTMHVYDFEQGAAFIAARSMEEAKVEYAELHSDYDGVPCRELTEAELDAVTVALLDEDDALTGESITMREHLSDCMTAETDEAAFYLCGRD